MTHPIFYAKIFKTINMAGNYLFLGLVVLLAILASIYMLWIIIPSISGLPWIPTRRQRIRRALKLAQLSAGEIIYDLGSGDGRVLVLAAREFGAYAIGVEISPLHCLAAKFNVLKNGVSHQVEIKWADFYNINISNVNVIYTYLTSREASLLKPRLESQLHPGSRVVTISCGIDGWKPITFDREELIFVYQKDLD